MGETFLIWTLQVPKVWLVQYCLGAHSESVLLSNKHTVSACFLLTPGTVSRLAPVVVGFQRVHVPQACQRCVLALSQERLGK